MIEHRQFLAFLASAPAIGRQPAKEREWDQNYEQPQSATEAYKAIREQSETK